MKSGWRVPGIYTLVLHLNPPQEIAVGSLGRLSFAAGLYSYTGSARGPGGLKRVDRHLQIMQGIRSTRRWHIDYLLPHTRLQEVIVTRTSSNLECRIASRIGEQLMPVQGFGCTDCRCISHLHYSLDLQEMLDAVRRAHLLSQGATESIE